VGELLESVLAQEHRHNPGYNLVMSKHRLEIKRQFLVL